MKDPGNIEGANRIYKIGDRVVVLDDCAAIHTYREANSVECSKGSIYDGVSFARDMHPYCGRTATVMDIQKHRSGINLYILTFDNPVEGNLREWRWTSWMLKPESGRRKRLKYKVRF